MTQGTRNDYYTLLYVNCTSTPLQTVDKSRKKKAKGERIFCHGSWTLDMKNLEANLISRWISKCIYVW